MSEREWKDGRFWFTVFLLPLGILAWAKGIPFLIYALFQPLFQPNAEFLPWYREIGFDLVFVLVILGTLWFVIGGIQAYFLEPRQIFIVRWARYRNGVFDLKGYFFKEARFESREVAAVEKHIADTHWFGPPGSWRYGTNLTRSQRMRCNYSLKVTLNEGRIFYFPGEMFEKEGPEELLKRLKPN